MGGRGSTDSLSLGTDRKLQTPFLAIDRTWSCDLQIYGLLFSWKHKDSPFKLSLIDKFIYFIILNPGEWRDLEGEALTLLSLGTDSETTDPVFGH